MRGLPSALALAAPAALGGYVMALALQCPSGPSATAPEVAAAGCDAEGALALALATAQWLLLPLAVVLAAGLSAASPHPLANRAELERSRCLLWRDLSLGPDELRQASEKVRGMAW